MSNNSTPAAGRDATSSNHPSTPPTSSFTPINALTPSSAMSSLFLDAPSPSQHAESALRSTIAREAAITQDTTMDDEDATRGASTSPVRPNYADTAMIDEDVVPTAPTAASPLGVDRITIIDENVASGAASPSASDVAVDEAIKAHTEALSTAPVASEHQAMVSSGALPASTAFQIPASFKHRVASLDDEPPIPPTHEALIKSLGTAAEAIAAPDARRSDCFPNNFDYAKYTTVEQLKKYLDPASPLAILHQDDVEQFEGVDAQQKAYSMVKRLQAAALAGYKIAEKVDHSSGTIDDIKKENETWSANWDEFLKGFEMPIEKGAGAVGYRVAKRQMMADAGKLGDFFICSRMCEEPSGCLTHQFRSEASRNAISNFFGRNRNATALMGAMRLWCRKHYQGMAYNDETWQTFKKGLICTVLDNNEASVRKNGKQGLTYAIELRKCDQERVTEVALKKGDGAPQDNNKHPSTLSVIQHIHDQYVGKGKTMAECKALAEYAHTTYKTELAAWKAGKEEKAIKKQIKSDGPKYVEFQLIPEWSKIYTKAEIAAATATTAAPGTPKGSAMAKRSPASKRKAKDEPAETGSPSTPSKKSKK